MGNHLLSFKGKSYHVINDNGRISIPAKFREILKNKYNDETLTMITLGSHIVAYPLIEWNKFEELLERERPNDPKVNDFLRYIYSTAEDCIIDRQGRVLIPPHLRESAGLKSECVIIGLRNKIEIWAKEKWEEQYDNINVGNLFNELSTKFPEINL
ncbi:MAG: division/cell wall cluster transcriptional repressor MraZ [Deferribacterales bacterium]